MAQSEPVKRTRMLFIGSAALTDGFRLIGFETLTNPKEEEIDRLITGLLERRENAFLVVEQRDEYAASRMLRQVRSEGGRIVLSEVPSLHDPSCFHCELDKQIEKLMGVGGLV